VIAVVVVSHSPRLAEAAVNLALEMVTGVPPTIAVAAGAGEGVIGTDATKVAAAIDRVSTPEGVIVLMDLGSAVLSATMALEFIETSNPVRLSDAPFVEGLVAAVVLAAAGASLDEITREAHGAIDAKRGQLESPVPVLPTPPAADAIEADETLVNPDGLHSRPAAAIVRAVSVFDAKVTIADLTTGTGPVAANSLVGLMSLGSRTGDVIRISATGPQAAEALERLRAMTLDGFGEFG
jgi:phosphoenolpyruvate---glycerone phosphotransferase subunit DhaM